MRLRTRSGRLLSAIGLGAVLSAVTAYAAIIQVCGAGPLPARNCPLTRPPDGAGTQFRPLESIGRESVRSAAEIASDVVMEWNQQAARALVGLACARPRPADARHGDYSGPVHDAVNGITGQYATYLSPGDAPRAPRPRQRHCGGTPRAEEPPLNQSPSLDDAFATHCDARLSEFDPGVGYGRAAAAAVLAARADDNSAAAQSLTRHRVPASRRLGAALQRGQRAGPAARVGGRDPVRAPQRLAVPARASAGARQRAVREGLQRDQNRRGVEQPRADAGADADRHVLAGLPDRHLEPRPASGRRSARPRCRRGARGALFYLAASTPASPAGAKYTYNFWRPLAIRRLRGRQRPDCRLPTVPLHPTPTPRNTRRCTRRKQLVASLLRSRSEGTGAHPCPAVRRHAQWDPFDEASVVIDARSTPLTSAPRRGRRAGWSPFAHFLLDSPCGPPERVSRCSNSNELLRPFVLACSSCSSSQARPPRSGAAERSPKIRFREA